MDTIAEAIAGYRRLNRQSQQDTGRLSGTSRWFVSRVERGERSGQDGDLGRLARAAGVPRDTVARLVADDELVMAGYDAQAQAQVTP